MFSKIAAAGIAATIAFGSASLAQADESGLAARNATAQNAYVQQDARQDARAQAYNIRGHAVSKQRVTTQAPSSGQTWPGEW